MFCTSRQPRFGFASSISATTPATAGVAEDVPPKPVVSLLLDQLSGL